MALTYKLLTAPELPPEPIVKEKNMTDRIDTAHETLEKPAPQVTTPPIAVAIDGPSGAGKSTLAKAAAEALGYTYVDTGACYRAIALYLLRHDIDPADETAVTAALNDIQLSLKYIEGKQHMFLGEDDVSEDIRTPEVTHAASVSSALASVRAWLLDFQRDLAKNQSVIMDGRDIGTVVLPQAQVKIFLTASAEERAQRRHKDFLANGVEIEYTKVLDDVRQRDARDSNRENAPLKQAKDAVLLDTTQLSFDKSLARILEIIKGK